MNRVPSSTPCAPERERRHQPPAVGDAAGRNHRHPHGVHHLGNERHRRDGTIVAGRHAGPGGAVAAGLGSLRHQRVDAGGRHRAGVRDAADHGDHAGAPRVTASHQVGARVAERDREDRYALLEDDLDPGVDHVGQAGRPLVAGRQPQPRAEAVERVLHGVDLGLRNRGHVERWPHLGVQPEVDAERPIGEAPHRPNALADLLGWQLQPGQDAEASGAAHLGHQLGPGDAAHPGLENRHLDAEEIAQRCAQRHGVTSRMACSRSLPRWTLSPCGPGVRGTSFTKRTRRGIL